MKRKGISAVSSILLLFVFAVLPWPVKGDDRKYAAATDEEPDETIVLHYHERPPYSYTVDGNAAGILVEPVELAFRRAGIPFRWQLTPASRQLKIIEDNRGYDGILGWFRNPERVKIGRFSHYIYQDSPTVVVFRADRDKAYEFSSLDELFSDRKLVLAVKNSYSYGSYIDGKIQMYNPPVDTVSTENLQIIQRIFLGRGDYFFIAPEELKYLFGQPEIPRDSFTALTLPDIPDGEKRYVLFSFRVDPALVEAINRELEGLVADRNP